MDVEAITLVLLQQMLDAWERDTPVPAIWQSFVAWPQLRGLSAAALKIRLFDLWRELAQQKLNEQRLAEGMTPVFPTTRAGVVAALVQDFGHSSDMLEAWSAFYHRHFSPACLSISEMETAVPQSRRNLDRRYKAGLAAFLACLQRQELAAHGRTQTARLCRHLPPPDYAHLFGVEPLLRQLLAWANAPTGLPFFSLEGLGGIGKTSVARTAVYEIVAHTEWADVLWVSARQYDLDTAYGRLQPIANAAHTFADIVLRLCEQLGQLHLAGLPPAAKLERLQPIFKANPHLVIIDNLETLADVDALIPYLEPLANPTRFLLTSRHTMSHYGTVQSLAVPALSFADSHALMQSELCRQPRPVTLTDEMMAHIYRVVGGLPLALKLLAAQLGHFPPDYLLDGLSGLYQADIYSFIYRHSWDKLDQPARRLLTPLYDLAPDGITFTGLRLMTDLPDEVFHQALAQLFSFNLLETAGPVENPLYKIHRLTATFLQTDIVDRWNGE